MSQANALREEIERLRTENAQLHRAVASHAIVDQAIGVLVCIGRISPDDGFSVLRYVSQRTNTRLVAVAEQLIKHAQGAALTDTVQSELRAALARMA
ncbi:AmiR/NasT family two-component response regulator [Streptomyces achromogenes]|uniref:AmiR/NasT family two-component response regulator n=1 Tax=Streptomyces achromogenes TaxID=67255 RepID=A0ABU0PZ42_STRAH|nr:ANTAR domain-containing protein [Streptomyces achromogenes]MDQ0683662.1 AmiR/NasT family two-component response regulator [Streptomyces achromogenes]